MINFLLIILGIIILIGLIRVLTKPFTTFIDLILDLFLIDLLIDGLSNIAEHIDFD